MEGFIQSGKMKLSDISPNPSNPRIIKDEKFLKLKDSINAFPKMMELRPIIVDETMTVLGGNMRLKALSDLGFKEIPDSWVKKASELSDEEKKQFIIKDNVGFGEWDWQDLQANWDTDKLEEWGLDVPGFEGVDYSDKNKEIDIYSMEDEMIIKLKFTEDEYNIVKAQLLKIAATPEQAVWKLLGNE